MQCLGFLIAWDKVVVPSTCVKYLGIEIDSVAMELRLPAHILDKLRLLVSEFRSKDSCSRRELQVLAGHLIHASTVVRGGRTFSRRVINLLKFLGKDVSFCALPSWFESDLDWCLSFCEVFNGKAKIIVDSYDHCPPL